MHARQLRNPRDHCVITRHAGFRYPTNFKRKYTQLSSASQRDQCAMSKFSDVSAACARLPVRRSPRALLQLPCLAAWKQQRRQLATACTSDLWP